jgi:hypothetical protein
MITCHNQAAADRLAEMVKFATENGLLTQLVHQLHYLSRYGGSIDPGFDNEDSHHCILGWDSAPLSLSFIMKRRTSDEDGNPVFNGALIFHGPHDGYGSGGAPTFAVDLSGTLGWSVHT